MILFLILDDEILFNFLLLSNLVGPICNENLFKIILFKEGDSETY